MALSERLESVSELAAFRDKLTAGRDPDRKSLSVCTSGCIAYGASKLAEALAAGLEQRGLSDRVDLKRNGCHGFCERGPLVVVNPGKLLYQRVGLDDVDEILDETIAKGEKIERLLFTDADDNTFACEDDVPFYKNQMRLLLGNNSLIDPTRIDDYIAIGGYSALAKVLTGMKPGKAKADGTYPKGTFNFMVDSKLQELSAALKIEKEQDENPGNTKKKTTAKKKRKVR